MIPSYIKCVTNKKCSGSIIIGLIVTMVLFAVLGAAMLSMFGSSSTGSVTSIVAQKALYMAESGMRYALSELKNSDFSEDKILTLNRKEKYTVDDAGSFEINVFGLGFESPSDQSITAAGQTLMLNVPAEGEIPDSLSIPDDTDDISVVNFNSFKGIMFDLGGTPDDNDVAVAQTFSKDEEENQLIISLKDPFTANLDDMVCLAVHPSSAQPGLQAGDILEISVGARHIFPRRNGAIYIKGMNYFYDERIDDVPGNRVRLTNLSEPSAAAGFSSGFPFDVGPSDYVVLSARNHTIITTGTPDEESSEVSKKLAMNFYDASRPKAGESTPGGEGDISPEKIIEELALPKISKTGAIAVDTETGEIKLGGNVTSAFGALWFGGTNNIGGVADYCTNGECQFNKGVRVVFKVDYEGTGDGFTLAFINGTDNDTTSVGGDAGAGELMAYGGDSRTGSSFFGVGYGFLDTTGYGLQSPKMALEFDTYTNAGDADLCSGTTFQSGQRNDPLSGDKDVLQYVFWGSKEGIDCRTNPAGPSPTYDDNKHDTGGRLEEWSYTTGGDVRSSPAIGSDGTIYVGSNDDNLYAINANDGTLKWSCTTPSGDVKSSPAISSDGSTIYAGSDDYKLYAINSSDGSEKWNFPTGDRVESSPAISSDGSTIYVGSNDDNLYAINANDGTLKWSYTTGGDVRSSPSIGSDGTIYVGSNDDNLYAINSDGSFKWSYTTGGDVTSSPVIGSDGTIYVGSHDDKLYAINSDGSFKWSYTTGGDVNSSSPAISSDGSTIYVGSNDDKLYAIDSDGNLKWSYTTGGDVRSSPAIGSDGTIYVGSNDDNLYVLWSDGTLRSAFDTGDNVESSPAIATDGTIYVGSNDNKLYAIDPTDNPRNIKDKYCTYEDLTADGIVVDSTIDWLNGTTTKGPWVVRVEVIRGTELKHHVEGDPGYYEYTLKTWIRQCDDLNCGNIDGTYFTDTGVGYEAKTPHLEQTIELSADDHTKFNTFLFGLTEGTGGAVQNVIITDLQVSFIRSGDAKIESDPNWP